MKVIGVRPLLLASCMLAVGVGASACEEELLEAALGIDEPTALRESELPNCSRVVNCCSKLAEDQYASILPSAVTEGCDTSVGTAADAAITEYQRERDTITNQTGITEERRSSLLGDLRDEWQGRVEPGCRCFVEQTVGAVSELVTPADCEPVTTTGSLSANATCTDAVDSLINFDTNN